MYKMEACCWLDKYYQRAEILNPSTTLPLLGSYQYRDIEENTYLLKLVNTLKEKIKKSNSDPIHVIETEWMYADWALGDCEDDHFVALRFLRWQVKALHDLYYYMRYINDVACGSLEGGD